MFPEKLLKILIQLNLKSIKLSPYALSVSAEDFQEDNSAALGKHETVGRTVERLRSLRIVVLVQKG